MGHETWLELSVEWSGLGVVVAEVPSPPPTWPTIMSDVGTEFPLANVRLFVSSIVKGPGGTIMTTGDQAAFGFNALQDPADVDPQR
jgi:hypothetical protein